MEALKAIGQFIRIRGYIARTLCAWSVLLVFCGMSYPTSGEMRNEYQIKAVFLFNFTQFVAWPDKSFNTENDPFIIGILGENPYGNFLEETVRGESVNGHRIIIRRYAHVQDIKMCHILYVNLKNETELEDAITRLKNRNILTVGDTAKFTQSGGIITFVVANNKVGLKINLDAVSSTELSISSKLLRLATIIKAKK